MKKENRTESIALRITKTELNAIETVAKRERISKSQLVRVAFLNNINK